MLLLDALSQALPSLLHRRICDSLLIVLLLQQLPVEIVLLFPDGLDAVEVVHVLDWRRAPTWPILVRSACRGELLSRKVLMH